MSEKTRRIQVAISSIMVLGYIVLALAIVLLNTPVDYPIYVMAAYGFLHHENVYNWERADFIRVAQVIGISRYAPPYPYPPLTALLAWLLGGLWLPYHWSLFLWSLVNSGAVLATGWLLGTLADIPYRRWIIRLGVWLFVPFFVSLYAGQVNPVVLLLAVIAWLSYRQAKDSGSVALSVSLLLKPLGIGLLAYLFWRMRWRAVILLLVCSLLFLLSSSVVLGPQALSLGQQDWPVRPYPPAQNLYSMVLRWFTQHAYANAPWHNPELAHVIGLALIGVIIAATLALCWPPGKRPWSDLEVGLILTAILLINARSWYHHYVFLVIPFSILIAYEGKNRGRKYWYALAIAYGFIELFGVGWHFFQGCLPLLDLATAGAWILWCLLAIELVRSRNSLQAS